MHEPAIGKAIWDLTLAMTKNAVLPDNVRQIAILVVGARFDAAYEIYAHIAVAEKEGMPAARLATLVADLKPTDLTREKASRSTLPMRWPRAARCRSRYIDSRCRRFGQHGANELIYLVGALRARLDNARASYACARPRTRLTRSSELL